MAVVMAAGLVSCGKAVLQTSHSGVSETQAQGDIELRLVKTQEVRAQINSLRDAIRPVSAILHDLGKAVDAQLEERPGGALGALLDRLEKVLRDAVSGMVETRADGSWVLERPLPIWVRPDGAGYACNVVLRVSGVKVPEGEAVTIAVSDCSKPGVPGAYDVLATMLVRSDGSREVVLKLPAMENIRRDTLSLDPCVLRTSGTRSVDFTCKPMALVSNQVIIDVTRLELHSDEQSTRAAVHASVTHLSRGLLGTADLVIEPGRPVDLRVCARGQSCGN